MMKFLESQLARLLGHKSDDAHAEELLGGSLAAFATRVTSIGIGYVFVLLVSRFYGAEAMGVFALGTTILQIVATGGRLGLDTAMVRFVAEHFSQGKPGLVKGIYIQAMKMVLPVSLLLSGCLFAIAPFLASELFHKPHLAPYIRLSSLGVVPMALSSVNAECLRGLKRVKEYIVFKSAGIFFFATLILIGVLWTLHGSGVPLGAYIAGLSVVTVLSFISWFRRSGLGKMETAHSMGFRELLDVSVPMLLAGSMMLVMQWTDTIMLGMFRAEEEVGIYNVAMRVSTITTIVLFSISSIAAPKFAEFYGSGDMEGLERAVRQSSKLIFWSSFPVLLILFLFPGFILGLFGHGFAAASAALVILLAGRGIDMISGPVSYVLQMTGNQRLFQNIILAAAGLNILLNAVLIPRMGINGAAVASMISIIFWNLTSVFYCNKRLGILTFYLPRFR